MTGREPGEGEAVVPDAGTPILPGTVAAAHLVSCAAGLAADTVSQRALACVADVHELDEVVRLLVTGQRHLSTALANLAEHVGDRPPVARSAELLALVEVLRAAAVATGHSAEALAEGVPLVEDLAEAAGGDTRL